MAIIFTGTTITAVNHTTTNIDTVVHTGTTVFTSGPPTPKTATPLIEVRYTGIFSEMQYRVRNNDSAPAVIIAGFGNPPTNNRGTVAPNAYTDWIGGGCQQGLCNVTIRATAQASGKEVSNLTSNYAM